MGLRRIIRPALLVTAFTVAGQATSFVTRVVVAALFGAQAEMDAFLAAVTLPQYVTAVFLRALTPVFVPVFVDYLARRQAAEAWRLASSLLGLALLVAGAVAAIGIVLAEPLLHLTAPGLGPDTVHLAAALAAVVWPSVVAGVLISLLTSIQQVFGRFGRAAAVPLAGAAINLLILVAAAHLLGIVAMAVATTVSAFAQAAILLRALPTEGWHSLGLTWSHPGVQQVLRSFLPLLLSGALIKLTPLLERFLASSLPEGSIAHLDYAFKVVVVASTLISTGVATVTSRTMAWQQSEGDLGALRHTLAGSARFMWLGVAPAIAIGAALAEPAIAVVFERGRFSPEDTNVVALLLRTYLLGLAAMCLGSVTGNALYVLRATRVIAVMGVVEAIAYVAYTAVLARLLGVVGIALGFVIYFNLSLAWQLVFIVTRTGGPSGTGVVVSVFRTGAAAAAAGVAARLGAATSAWFPGQLLIGGALGLVVYGTALLALRSDEVRALQALLRDVRRRAANQ